MFHIPKTDAASWGANLPSSPVELDTEHREVPEPGYINPLLRVRIIG
jgi:hypothetical protein